MSSPLSDADRANEDHEAIREAIAELRRRAKRMSGVIVRSALTRQADAIERMFVASGGKMPRAPVTTHVEAVDAALRRARDLEKAR